MNFRKLPYFTVWLTFSDWVGNVVKMVKSLPKESEKLPVEAKVLRNWRTLDGNLRAVPMDRRFLSKSEEFSGQLSRFSISLSQNSRKLSAFSAKKHCCQTKFPRASDVNKHFSLSDAKFERKTCWLSDRRKFHVLLQSCVGGDFYTIVLWTF